MSRSDSAAKWMNRAGWALFTLGVLVVEGATVHLSDGRRLLILLGVFIVAVGTMTTDLADERQREQRTKR